MKPVLSTTDHSLVENVRLALESEGIAAVIKNDAGSPLPMIPVVVMVQDADFDRANELVRSFEDDGA
ncbi:MAG: DUF2007 domain-containing protein [Candidatus Acidiferrales bacterium]